MATATPTKTREVKYFEMTGTAAGTQMKLTSASRKALEQGSFVLGTLAKAGKIFPKANGLKADIDKFLADPTADPNTTS